MKEAEELALKFYRQKYELLMAEHALAFPRAEGALNKFMQNFSSGGSKPTTTS
jgi:hypothetical protein